MKNRFIIGGIAFVLILLAINLTGCGNKTPESISIVIGGEEVKNVEMLYGEDISGVSVLVSPESLKRDVTFESDDTSVVKVTGDIENGYTLVARKTGTVKVTASCNGLKSILHVKVNKDQNNLSAVDIALTINGESYSVERCNVYYAQMYYDFLKLYGDDALYYGIDTSQGIKGIANQSCDYAEDGTWRGYFLEQATAQMEQMQALCDYAKENNIELTAEDETEIEGYMDELNECASENGYTSVEDYLNDFYGEGVTLEFYRQFVENRALANRAYDVFVEKMNFTDEEIANHYLEMGYSGDENDYPMTSMRHILIMAVQDEASSEYSKEAINEAHKKAEDILAKWKEGDMTQDSFAELANEYSEDSGSNTTGGLYENITKDEMVEGINDWLFDGNRKSGDVAVIDNNGSYVGTHVVYFVDNGEIYSHYLSRTDLESSALSEWINKITENYKIAEGRAYSEIGVY